MHLRPTYDKPNIVCPALLLLWYDKVWKENKARRDTLFTSAAVALMAWRENSKWIYEKWHFNEKITNNPLVWTPSFYGIFKALTTSFISFASKTAQ